jgi:hypothetical protein
MERANDLIRAAARVERDPPGAPRARRDDTLHLGRLNLSLNWNEFIGSTARNLILKNGNLMGYTTSEIPRTARNDSEVIRAHPWFPATQISPSFILPSSEIICWVHGGSQVMRTSASDTPGTRRIFDLASSAMAGPMPQPGAVSVMVTSTR